MLYDFKKDQDKKKARERLESLIKSESKTELKKILPKRTNKQNNYLHVLFNLYAINFGYTLREAKELIKSECSFNKYLKNGVQFSQGTSEMTTGELGRFIDWFRFYAQNESCYLPTSEEYINNLIELTNEINRHKEFL